MPRKSNTSRRLSDGELNPLLKELLERMKFVIRAAFAFSFAINLLMLTVPIFLLQVYERVIPSQNVDTLWVLAGIAGLAVVTMAVLEAGRRSLLTRAGLWAEHRLAPSLFSSAVLRAVNRGEPSASILEDVRHLSRFASSGALMSLLDAPWAPIFLLVIFLLHPVLGLAVALGGCALLGLAFAHEKLRRSKHRDTSDRARGSIELAGRYVQNAEVIHAMGMHMDVAERWCEDNRAVLARDVDAGVINARFVGAAKLTRSLLQIAVISIAAWLILQGQLSGGAIIAVVLLMRRAIAPLEFSIHSWHALANARRATQRVRQYLDHAPDLQNLTAMPAPSGGLVAEGISYRFKGAEKSLFSRVDLQVGRGECVVITGQTGAGKSTFVRTLVGARPLSSGRILLGGNDIAQWQPMQLGRFVGYLPQDVELFPGTVRDNIARMQSHDLEDVVRAARKAGIHALVQSLPNGYDTQVGFAGSNLSGGQRQRVALARALFGEPRLVVLDEPDASLDSDGLVALIQALDILRMEGASVVMVTHQPALRRFVDRSYELRNRRLRPVDDHLARKRLQRRGRSVGKRVRT